eukprot:6465973-Amphidinium_carterae.1
MPKSVKSASASGSAMAPKKAAKAKGSKRGQDKIVESSKKMRLDLGGERTCSLCQASSVRGE